MVHVSKCPLGKNQRGMSTTEFYHNGKPQKYCYGRIDMMTEEALEECKACKDWVYGRQFDEDFETHLREVQQDANNNRN